MIINAVSSRQFKNLPWEEKGLRKRLFKAILMIFIITACAGSGQENPRVDITIFPQNKMGHISPYIFGVGIDATTNPMRFCKYQDKVARDIAESGVRIARYPGGFVFSRYDHRGSWKNFYWQDHIGKNPQKNPFYTYDLDTFLQMCEWFGIEPMMQINFVGEPRASIQGYIEYLVGYGDIDGDGINWAAKRVENGRKEPYHIRYWELGNEVHDYEQGFQPNVKGVKEYAEAVNQLVPILRKMSPDSKIVLPFINIERPLSGMQEVSSPKTPDSNFATSGEFALAFLEYLSVRVDYLDWHFYPANGWDGNYPFLGTDNEWKHYYCWGTKFRECYDVIVKLIKEHYKMQPLPKIVVGEWSGDWTGCIFREKENSYRGSMMRTMASAVFMADVLMFIMEKSIPSEHIYSAFWHNFANGAQELFSIQATEEYQHVLGPGRTWKGEITDEGYGVRMPVYWVFKLISEQRGDELVETRVVGENNRIEAPQNGLYWDPEFNFDRVMLLATRKGNLLYLAALNKDANLSVDLRIDIRGWNVEKSVKRYAVGAASYLAENSMKQPDNITLSGSQFLYVNNSADPQVLLPPNTLIVLRFRKY